MGEAIDALHALATQHLDEAQAALLDAQRAHDQRERAREAAEADVVAHDEDVRRRLAPDTSVVAISPASLARDDAYRRAMRQRRETLLEAVQRAARQRDESAHTLELTRTALADARARARAVEVRLEARALTRRKAAEAKSEDEADEHRRR